MGGISTSSWRRKRGRVESLHERKVIRLRPPEGRKKEVRSLQLTASGERPAKVKRGRCPVILEEGFLLEAERRGL
jgi:hypothetical protein